eukprot:UN03368
MEQDDEAFYQLVIPAPDRIILSIYNKKEKTQNTIVFKKISIELPKTFWQNYGTWIMMLGLMILNMYVQSKSREFAAPPSEEQEKQKIQAEIETLKKSTKKSKKD